MDKPAAFSMTLTLRIRRQKNRRVAGRLVDYQVQHISPDMSFLEMLEVLNEALLRQPHNRR